jgi:hypothetical protein
MKIVAVFDSTDDTRVHFAAMNCCHCCKAHSAFRVVIPDHRRIALCHSSIDPPYATRPGFSRKRGIVNPEL